MSVIPCGLEIAARTLWVVLGTESRPRHFANTPTGHRQLIAYLTHSGRPVKVCMEATGTYGVDVAFALQATAGIDLMVANPRAARRFAESLMTRAKTDRVDARVLCEFAARMPTIPWQPPTTQALALRALARRIASLKRLATQEKNRRHASSSTRTTPQAVLDSFEPLLECLGEQIASLRQQALTLIRADELLARRFDLLTSVTGIGEVSAIQLLAELAVLPDDLDVRQWVAHAGLDPRPYESGSSVHRRRSISRTGNAHLRHALYMPALVAARWDPHCRAFYELLQRRGKTKTQALVALMRKLLHGVFGLWKNDQPYDPNKLFPTARLAATP